MKTDTDVVTQLVIQLLRESLRNDCMRESGSIRDLTEDQTVPLLGSA